MAIVGAGKVFNTLKDDFGSLVCFPLMNTPTTYYLVFSIYLLFPSIFIYFLFLPLILSILSF